MSGSTWNRYFCPNRYLFGLQWHYLHIDENQNINQKWSMEYTLMSLQEKIKLIIHHFGIALFGLCHFHILINDTTMYQIHHPAFHFCQKEKNQDWSLLAVPSIDWFAHCISENGPTASQLTQVVQPALSSRSTYTNACYVCISPYIQYTRDSPYNTLIAIPVANLKQNTPHNY